MKISINIEQFNYPDIITDMLRLSCDIENIQYSGVCVTTERGFAKLLHSLADNIEKDFS